jgi:uncharacterized membrane protein
MKPFTLKNIILFVLTALPFLYLYIVFPELPQQVPMHYGSDMQPDRFGDKTELWFPIILLMSVSLISYFIISNIYRIDPKMSDGQPGTAIQKIALAIVGFFSFISMYIIYSTVQGQSGSLLFVIIGLLFAVLGNFMYNIKPNYFVGLRLPWTLDDDENWKETHRLAAKIWVAGGILISIFALLLPMEYIFPFFMVCILIMVFWPAIFSFLFYRKKKLHP